MANITPSINLLHTKQKTTLDKILDWALTVGRFLVIVTETIALITFVSRFSLDRQLVNLHDEIKRHQQILRNFQATEKTMRSFQDRLAVVKKLDKAAVNTTTLVKDILIASQKSGTVTAFNVSENTIRIDCNVKSIAAITSLTNTIKAYPLVKSVSLDRIENKTTSAYIAISITASLKKEKK